MIYLYNNSHLGALCIVRVRENPMSERFGDSGKEKLSLNRKKFHFLILFCLK